MKSIVVFDRNSNVKNCETIAAKSASEINRVMSVKKHLQQ